MTVKELASTITTNNIELYVIIHNEEIAYTTAFASIVDDLIVDCIKLEPTPDKAIQIHAIIKLQAMKKEG